MRVIIDLGHPAQLHLFKHTIWNLQKKGHEILITARNKDVLLKLLDIYHFTYVNTGPTGKNIAGLAIELIRRDIQLFQLARTFKPDVLVGESEVLAHVGKILGIPSLIFTDTEHAKLSNMITFPFADIICTPSCYFDDIGKKQIRYDGYHELAYLHPNYFTPDPAVLDEIKCAKGDPFIILRFVAWKASHDIGQYGIRDKVSLVRALEQYGKVFITSEAPLGRDLEPYQIRVSPEKLHDLLYYATLYIGDGGTTASEAAVLGTPAIFISTIFCGYHVDEEKYGLLHLFSDPNKGMESGLEMAKNY